MPKKVLLDSEQIEIVDGVRALAVLAVIALHWKNILVGQRGAAAALTTPGTGGVIVFFVVSGFCITLSKKAQESWASFYLRRAFRLLPACWFSLALYLMVIKIGWNRTVAGRELFASFMIVPNWLGQATVAGWNGLASELSPVLWSLQTEIELYLLFPLSLLLYRLMPRRAFLGLTFAITVGAWSGWVLSRHSFDYFPPFPALCHWFIWNLGFYLCFNTPEKAAPRRADLLTGLGALALGAVTILLRNIYHSNRLSFWYFLTGLGAYFFIKWALAAKPLWLRCSLLTKIGRRSYSYYLNHWPSAIVGTLLFHSRFAAAGFAMIALALVGEFSYRMIELPFIRAGKSLAAALDSRVRSEAAAIAEIQPNRT